MKLQAVINASRATWTLMPRPISRKITHRFGKIKHVSHIQAMRWVSEEQMRDYFKFAFVRSPWDWTVSLYFYILKDKNHDWHAEVAKMSDFGGFLDFYLATRPGTQKCFLFNGDGQMMMDFVGRFQNLDADFAHICRRLDIHQDLGKKNTSNHKPYLEYYTPKRRDTLGAWLEKDIKEFNYSFAVDGSSTPRITEAAAK